ncbi:MAG: BREX system Lon protease-like protein BrxL [Candidatus Cloacimonetes bacterium]|nr:BREX system Lon protease-like protein BrxL [Candidatus Cloacimonadota bacterium]
MPYLQQIAIPLDEKIQTHFPLESVYKDPEAYSVFTGRNLPSFVKDWMIKCFSEHGSFDKDACAAFIEEKIPRKGSNVRRRLLHSRQPLQIFSRLIITTDLLNGKMSFSIPDLGIGKKEGIVSQGMAEHKIQRLHEGEVWGILTLTYIPPGFSSSKGYVELTDFKPFEPYRVNLEYFLDARSNFSTLEWIDLLIRCMETNPDYTGGKTKFSLNKKLTYLSRLLVYVEPNLNMIELAPKGTGKSYIFNNLSKYSWAVSGGIVTRAGIFYNLSTRSPGIIHHYDFLALDEIETLQFAREEDILGAFKNYLENGKIVVGNYQNISDCGLMLLGNIALNSRYQPKNREFFKDLPSFFQSSALIDRIHGFIPGWVLYRFTEDLKLTGYALNSEYFAEIMHNLRFENRYSEIVKEALIIPRSADTRDTKAVLKLCTAYLKLLYPHARTAKDIPAKEFQDYVLTPALRCRAIIRQQLAEMDSEYSPCMPDIRLREF